MGLLSTDKVPKLQFKLTLHSWNSFLCDGVRELVRGSLEAVLERSNNLTLGIMRKKLLERIFRFLDQILASIAHCKIIQELIRLKWDSQDEL